MAKAPVLQRSRKDWIAVGAITAVCAVAVGGAVLSANINQAQLTQDNLPGDAPVTTLESAPDTLRESFRLDHQPTPGQYRPVVANQLIISNSAHEVVASNADGTTAWTYRRDDAPICSLGTAWDKVVIGFETGVGCGDVVAIDAANGQYADTRSAINSADVVNVSSNDRVGTVSTERVELWRSDMVRTVEYGEVEAKQEADFQPNEECTINSALTRTELLVVAETCPGSASTTWLRFHDATPEDSRKPEIKADVSVNGDGARLVAVGQTAATVYVPGDTPALVSFDEDGQETSRSAVASSPAVQNAATPFAPATADSPNHMSWYDGERLYMLTPTNLTVDHVIEEAIGTGVAVGERLLVPVKDGIAVFNWSSGRVERTIDVDRQGFQGPVYLSLAGSTVVEQRDTELVVLEAS